MADPCVLITGANGFIGSYTALLFESLERKIVPLDVGPRGRELSLLPITTATHSLDVTDAKAIRERRTPPRTEDPTLLEFCLQATGLPTSRGSGWGTSTPSTTACAS